MPRAETVAELKLKPELPPYCARFRQGRKAAMLSLHQLAQHMAISKQAILGFETGKQRLSLDRFALACSLLQLNTQWVLFGTGQMFNGPPSLIRRPMGYLYRLRSW